MDNEFDPQRHNEKLTYLEKPVMFNIMMVVDITNSKLSQVRKIQDIDIPNSVSDDGLNDLSASATRPKIVRQIDVDAGQNDDSSSFRPTRSIYKLLLKDRFNNYSFAYEHNDKLSFLKESHDTTKQLYEALGSRLLVNKGTMIRHGALLLTRASCDYIGKVEEDKELLDTLGDDIMKKYVDVLISDIKG